MNRIPLITTRATATKQNMICKNEALKKDKKKNCSNPHKKMALVVWFN